MIYLLTFEGWYNHTTAPHITNIDIDELKNLLNTNFSNYKTAKDKIYRGISNMDFYKDINVVDPKQITRESPWANGNIHNLILSNSPLWEKYPKRNKSVLFDIGSSGHGGEKFIVIPENDANIGICPEDDMWSAFPGAAINALFNEVLVAMLSDKIKFFDNKKANHDYKYLMECVSKLDEIKTELDADYKREYFEYRNFILPHKTVTEAINIFIDPTKNNFKTIKYTESFGLNLSWRNREGWTDSKCILVKEDILDDIMKNIKDLKN
jgi:hypothetical protein